MSEMPEHQDDALIVSSFSDYRNDNLPLVRPLGFAPVAARARARARTRAVGLAAAVVLAVGTPTGLIIWGHGGGAAVQPAVSPSTTATPPVPPTSPPPSATTSAPVAPPATGSTTAACTASDLSARAGASGSVSNQPFTTIVLTNHSDRACTLTGYPTLTNVRAVGAGSAIPVKIMHGGIYERNDPGSTTVHLAPGAVASFAVGTGTANDGPIYQLRTATLHIAGGSLTVPLDMMANGPSGQKVPIIVTAFAAGSNAGN